jgi:hypothetical protein
MDNHNDVPALKEMFIAYCFHLDASITECCAAKNWHTYIHLSSVMPLVILLFIKHISKHLMDWNLRPHDSSLPNYRLLERFYSFTTET